MNQKSRGLFLGIPGTLFWCLLFVATAAHGAPSITAACQESSLSYDRSCRNVTTDDPKFQSCMQLLKKMGVACGASPAPNAKALDAITPACQTAVKKYCGKMKSSAQPTVEDVSECYTKHQKEIQGVCGSKP